jgi:hypothetical protein
MTSVQALPFKPTVKLLLWVPGGDDVGSGIAVQADGRVVVVGTSNSGSGNSEFAVARFNDDGSLDNSFGVGGLVTTSFSGGDDVGSGIAVQADGSVSTSMAALTTLLALAVW